LGARPVSGSNCVSPAGTINAVSRLMRHHKPLFQSGPKFMVFSTGGHSLIDAIGFLRIIDVVEDDK
jgi:hypothetical protein